MVICYGLLPVAVDLSFSLLNMKKLQRSSNHQRGRLFWYAVPKQSKVMAKPHSVIVITNSGMHVRVFMPLKVFTYCHN